MHRRLGASEHAIWLGDQITPLHFALTARIVGEFRIDQLEQALIEVQQRHPMLRVRIALDEEGQPMFVEDNARIPLRVVVRAGEQHWQQEIERELSHSYNWDKAPLLRVVLFQSIDSSYSISEIVIICHHAIGDGLSSAYLLRDILQAMSNPEEQKSLRLAHPPFEDLIPHFGGTSPSLETVANEEEDTPGASPVNAETARYQAFSPRLLSWSLSTEETAALVARCRQEQTTVHAAICAAALGAIVSVGETQSQRNAPLKCYSPISIRKHLDATMSEEFGVYFSGGNVSMPIDFDNLSLWEIARALKERLDRKRRKIFEDIAGLQGLMSTHPSASLCWQIFTEQYYSDLIVSNLGCLNFASQFGQLQLEAIYGPAVMNMFRTVHGLIGVATVRGRMFFTLTYSETQMSPVRAEQYLQLVMQHLKS